jgi:hypothetical protein
MSHLSRRQMRRLAVLRVMSEMGVIGGPYDAPERYTEPKPKGRRSPKHG